MRAITINGGMEMRGWYDITDADFERAQDRAGIDESTAILGALIERENRRGINTKTFFSPDFLRAARLFCTPVCVLPNGSPASSRCPLICRWRMHWKRRNPPTTSTPRYSWPTAYTTRSSPLNWRTAVNSS